jgi:DNA-binding NarL/FixJ family response regulator
MGTISFMSMFPGQTPEFSKLWLEYRTNYLQFSPAERGIITDIAKGMTDREIAEDLHFSTGTVRNYISAIIRKTKLKTRSQIAVYSLTCGLINFDQVFGNIFSQK